MTRRKRCPLCDREPVHEFRPFCSRRCADRDLGNWASGAYAIPTNERADDPRDPEE